LKARKFKDLKVWQLGKQITIDIYGLTNHFPVDERYGLVSQMRRSAISIVSNIAEGFNRYHNKEYQQFLYIALGSCAELESQLEIAYALKFVSVDQWKQICEYLDHESRMLRSLIKKLT
jgi:four helix bundle protein